MEAQLNARTMQEDNARTLKEITHGNHALLCCEKKKEIIDGINISGFIFLMFKSLSHGYYYCFFAEICVIYLSLKDYRFWFKFEKG